MKRVCAAYALVGAILWFVPLLNVLQVESAAVIAFVAFFVSGWAAIDRFRSGAATFGAVIGEQEAALLIPLGMLTISQLWTPNCTYVQGLLFFALFPGITVAFAVALSYLLTGAELRRPFGVLTGMGLMLSLIGPVYDLGFHPQFYTYNHVFGGVLGPIYDEQLALRWGLFAFRGVTILWTCVAFFGGRILRGKRDWTGLVASVAVIGLCYSWAVPLGLNTTESYLQKQLGGHVRTTHFDIYYSPDRLNGNAVEALASDHEAIYRWLKRRLDLRDGEGPGRIQSYLYPNPDAKASLTGARYTSVSPVWLGRPQVHILVSRLDASLGHELAHTFSRQYGIPLINASWSPGLVEGWAVALEPPSPYPSPHDLVRVGSTTGTAGGLSIKADALADRLTPWGFWTGRGAVSYAMMGSFTQYLLENHGPEPLKAVYGHGDFEAEYERSLPALARGWSEALASRPMISRSAHEVVAHQFTRPSLFEVDCPHYVPPHRQHLQAAQEAERRGDSSAAVEHLHEALADEPRYTAAHAELARRRLASGKVSAVRQQLDTLDVEYRSVQIQLLQADARAIQGESEAARRLYENARRELPMYAHDALARLMARSAAADQPEIIEVLVGGDGATKQAKALASIGEEGRPVVLVWQALRYMDAHRYAEADSVLRSMPPRWTPDGSRPSKQSYSIQTLSWKAEAALHSDHFDRAKRTAEDAARVALNHGAREWAENLNWWARRASNAASDQSAKR